MLKLILLRAVLGIASIWVISLLVFAITDILPGEIGERHQGGDGGDAAMHGEGLQPAAAPAEIGGHLAHEFLRRKRFFQRGFHTHSKLDATVRSFIARRNINLPVFLLGCIFGLARETFFLIAAWQVATAAYHGIRTFWILVVQKAHRNPHAKPVHVAADLD